MKSIVVKLPDEKTMEVSPNQRIHDLISTLGIDDRVIAAKLDGVPVDLDRSLTKDCSLDWISLDSPEGLDILRHSTAHLMAQAVQSLYPDTHVTIG
ncbi:MAG: threonine--tRNA ligase, partial [Candidatus Binatia bacterium]